MIEVAVQDFDNDEGIIQALEPLGRSITGASEPRQNGKPSPMRQGFGTDAAPRMELSPQGRPRFGSFACTFAGGGDVERDRFFLHGANCAFNCLNCSGVKSSRSFFG